MCATRSPPSCTKARSTPPSPPSTSRLGCRSRTSPTAPRWPSLPIGPSPAKGHACRLIVRRVEPTPGSQLALLANYAYHPFITDRPGDMVDLEADHRRHAEVENAIRDLKYGVGLNHLPSGRFGANAAWLGLNVIAHNLARWTSRIGGIDIETTRRHQRRHAADRARPAAPQKLRHHRHPPTPLPGHPRPPRPPPAAASPCTCPPAGPGPTSSTPCSTPSAPFELVT